MTSTSISFLSSVTTGGEGSVSKGCLAQKHVERATDDPAMLVVTYEGEHRHTPGAAGPSPLATASPVAAPLASVSAGNGHV